jgi:hypothetical protein
MRNSGLGAIKAAVLAVAALAVTFAAAAEEPLVIQGYNTAILDCGDPYAAAMLQHYLLKCVAKSPDADNYVLDSKAKPDRKASALFPVFGGGALSETAREKNLIYVGPVANIPADLLPDAQRQRLQQARRGSVLLWRTGRNLVLTKRDNDLWNLNPMRLFLDRWAGVRMYAPSGEAEWLSMPKDSQFTVDRMDLFMQPYFAKTTFSSGGHKRNSEWLRMNTILSEGVELRANHAIIRYFPPAKYYDKHPQLYPMHANGTRPRPIGDAWNPCFADPDLAAQVAMEEVRGQMAKQPAPGYLSFGVMDCAYDCHCPVCAASLKEHKGNAANLWYAFLNRVARQCQKEFPALYLTNYAYSNIRIPKDMRIEPNIVVDCVLKSYRFTDPAYWEAAKREILAFADLGARWVTHDWNFQGVTPRIYTRQLAGLLQWGAQNGMLGIYSEWSGLEHWYVSGAHYWALRQLLADPYQDPDGLWRQYCRDMYGDGWEPMYRFYDMFQQKHVVADRYHQRDDWPRRECLAFTEEDLAQQRKWLEAAIAATRDDPMIQKRLAVVMRYFRGHEMLALAVGVPGRLHHEFTTLNKQTGVNKEALAFYVNDDGGRLIAFDEYCDTQRTVPPDSNEEDQASGIRFSYRANYSRALGTIIQAIKAQAMQGVDMTRGRPETVAQVVEAAKRAFREALPERHNPKRTQEIEALVSQFLLIPRVETIPVVDGDLSDAAWSGAAKLEGWTQADLLVPTRDGNETEGRIMRVGDCLVIGLVCRQPKGIWAQTPADIETGTRIWRESGCEVFLGPPVKAGEKQEYFQYIVNAFGAFRGFQSARDNRKGVQCAARMSADKTAYTIEVALPLKAEGLYDYSTPGVYTFNVMRNPFYADTFNSKERIGWAPIFFTAGAPESRGLVVLE